MSLRLCVCEVTSESLKVIHLDLLLKASFCVLLPQYILARNASTGVLSWGGPFSKKCISFRLELS